MTPGYTRCAFDSPKCAKQKLAKLRFIEMLKMLKVHKSLTDLQGSFAETSHLIATRCSFGALQGKTGKTAKRLLFFSPSKVVDQALGITTSMEGSPAMFSVISMDHPAALDLMPLCANRPPNRTFSL